MSVHRIASRYAKSLIELAQEKGKLDAVLEDWKTFGQVNQSREFSAMLKSPIIMGDKKKSIFDAIFKGKLDDLTAAFFDIIIRKGRESLLPNIAEEFQVQYKSLKHISSVKLTTASALSESALEIIRKKILASDATDDNLQLEVAVDESLIGGFVIELDNKRFDASVAKRLDLLKKEFRNNEYVREL